MRGIKRIGPKGVERRTELVDRRRRRRKRFRIGNFLEEPEARDEVAAVGIASGPRVFPVAE